MESDEELLDRLESASKRTRIYGVIDYGIRKEFYRVMLGYSPAEQFDNYFPIGQALSVNMRKAQYAVTERLYSDLLKTFDGRMRERLGKLSFEFTKDLLSECLAKARKTKGFTYGEHKPLIAVLRGERKPESEDEKTRLKNYRRKIYEKAYAKSERRMLFNAVENLCGEAFENKPFYKGIAVKYPVATVKSIKTVFDTGNDFEIFSDARQSYFNEFGYRYVPVSKKDIRNGLAETIVADALRTGVKLAELA